MFEIAIIRTTLVNDFFVVFYLVSLESPKECSERKDKHVQ